MATMPKSELMKSQITAEQAEMTYKLANQVRRQLHDSGADWARLRASALAEEMAYQQWVTALKKEYKGHRADFQEPPRVSWC